MEKVKDKKVLRFIDCWRNYCDQHNISSAEAVDRFLLYPAISDVLAELGLTMQQSAAMQFREMAVQHGYMYELKLQKNGTTRIRRWMKNMSHPRWSNEQL